MSFKFTWLSNSPAIGTGYGSQTRLFLPRFKAAGYDPAAIAFYGLDGCAITWNGIRVYGKHRQMYAMDVAGGHTIHHGAKVMLSLMDAFVMEPALLKMIKFVPWFPVDCDPLPKPIARVIEHAYERLTMSRYGEQVVKAAGFDSTYIPHGFDPAIFKPHDKAEARKKLGLPADAFLVSMVAANKGIPSRKSFPQQLDAFARFAAKHSDAMLYLHTNDGATNNLGGYNLVEAIERYNIEKRTILVDQYEYLLGYPDEYVAQVYAASDVLLSVSMGEGFGIPIIEAQACGTPVITGDWTSMSEITHCGWLVRQHEAERYLVPIGGFQWLPHISAIVDRLDHAYDMSDEARANISRVAVTRMNAEYAVDVVMEQHWKPYLDRLAARLDAEERLGSSRIALSKSVSLKQVVAARG